MKLSQKGIDLIKKHEGFSEKAYLCPAKVWTIGYGSTFYQSGQRVNPTDKITKEQAEILLRQVLEKFEKEVDVITRDDLKQGQFDALVSFAYNVGVNALKNSTLLKKVNGYADDFAIALQFRKWVNAGGRKLQGLVNRREDEIRLWRG
jgi:lysozyme